MAIFELRRNIHSNELTPSWYVKYFISIAYMTSFVIWVSSMSMTSLSLTQLEDATHVFPGSQTLIYLFKGERVFDYTVKD